MIYYVVSWFLLLWATSFLIISLLRCVVGKFWPPVWICAPPSNQAVPLVTPPGNQAIPLATPSSNQAVPLATPPSNQAVPMATPPSNQAVPLATSPSNQAVPLATQIYLDTTITQPNRAWFSVRDILSRLGVCLVGFIWAAISRPLSFLHFTYLYHKIFTARWAGIGAVLFLPLVPLVLLIKAVLLSKLSFLTMLDVDDEDLESMRFFTNDLSPAVSTLYDYTQEMSNYVANFYILGPNELALRTMYWDTPLTTKRFWRGQLVAAGAAVPECLGEWNEGRLEMEGEELPDRVLVKVVDSCMGVGDKFLTRGTHYNTRVEIESLMEESYEGKSCILLRVVRPLPRLGVHSLDILTARASDGSVMLVDVIVWSGSATDSSHSATRNYMIHPETGEACNYGRWYNPNFAGTGSEGLGVIYPGVKEAVQLALTAHRNLPYDWLKVIGWDCMITEDGSVVFFEGNLAAWRCPRRLFLTLPSFIFFASYLA
eukprot:sb/3464227/